MNCYCLVASALIGSSIATGVLVNYTHYTNFEKSLDEDQTKIYTKIRNERLYIYLFATFLGMVLGVMNRSDKCLAVSSALFTQIFVYKIWPKSDYMLNHTKNNEQSKLWMKQYTHMTTLSNVGMLAGFISFFVIKKYS